MRNQDGEVHTRLFLANQLYPQQIEGFRVSGRILHDRDWWDYDAYFGVEDDSPDDPISGARLGYHIDPLELTLAVNYGRGTRQDLSPTLFATNFGALQSPFPGAFNAGRDYEFAGVDVEWRTASLTMKTEAYYGRERGFLDQRAFSTEWTWYVDPKFGLSYRFDWYDRGSDLVPLAGSVLSLGVSTEHVVGVSYNPNESVRLRLDFHHNNLPNSGDTAQYLNLSWSLSF